MIYIFIRNILRPINGLFWLKGTYGFCLLFVFVLSIHCSKACGPFVNHTTSWEALPAAVSQLPHGVQTFLYALSSETFAVSFFVVTWWVLSLLFYALMSVGPILQLSVS